MRRPSRLVLEPADRANPSIGAQIEPMTGPARHANHVSSLDFDGDYVAVEGMDVKDAASGDDEAHFVFVVRVLGPEPVEQGVEPGRLGVNVDDIRRGVSAFALHRLDLRGIGRKYGVRISIRSNTVERPALIVDSYARECGRHFGLLAKENVSRRDCYGCHRQLSILVDVRTGLRTAAGLPPR